MVAYGAMLVAVEDEGRELTTYQFGPPEHETGRLQVTADGRRSLAVVLPGAEAPINCITASNGQQTLLFVVPMATGRGLFLMPASTVTRGEWQPAMRLTPPAWLLDSDVTACTATQRHLYFAGKGRGLVQTSLTYDNLARQRADIDRWTFAAPRQLGVPGGPATFVALAAAERPDLWEVLYAVAGDDAVYRFTGNGLPDQRIEMETPRPPAR